LGLLLSVQIVACTVRPTGCDTATVFVRVSKRLLGFAGVNVVDLIDPSIVICANAVSRLRQPFASECIEALASSILANVGEDCHWSGLSNFSVSRQFG
jgi:hypothetical protein